MTLEEISASKELTEDLQLKGRLVDVIKEQLDNTPAEKRKDALMQILKIANRVVKFSPDYEEPEFENGDLAASVLELTFNQEGVSDVPFTNAAAYLLNIGSYQRTLDISLRGFEKFPENLEILHKASQAAEALGDEKSLEIIAGYKNKLFELKPDSVAEEMNIMVMNWRIDEAKALAYRFSDNGNGPAPKVLAKLLNIYAMGYKDERTDAIADRTAELFRSASEKYVKDPELAYNASLFFLNHNNRWKDSETVLSSYISSGMTNTPAIFNQILSVSIISKDKNKASKALREFLVIYNNDKNYFADFNYAFANVSNCYALLMDKPKAIEYLKLAVEKNWDISYVKDMEDYKFMKDDPEFQEMFKK